MVVVLNNEHINLTRHEHATQEEGRSTWREASDQPATAERSAGHTAATAGTRAHAGDREPTAEGDPASEHPGATARKTHRTPHARPDRTAERTGTRIRCALVHSRRTHRTREPAERERARAQSRGLSGAEQERLEAV